MDKIMKKILFLFIAASLIGCGKAQEIVKPAQDAAARKFMQEKYPGCEITSIELDTVYIPFSVMSSLEYSASKEATAFVTELNNVFNDKKAAKQLVMKHDSIAKRYWGIFGECELQMNIQFINNKEPLEAHKQRARIKYISNGISRRTTVYTQIGREDNVQDERFYYDAYRRCGEMISQYRRLVDEEKRYYKIYK